MRQALLTRKPIGRGDNLKVYTFPAPTGGWNAKDSMSTMGKSEAFVLDNFVAVPGGIQVRPGRMSWATGLNGPVESLMEWASSSGSSKLFGATPTDIYDVTANIPVGTSAQTSLSNGRWQDTNFSTLGGHYLVICNGVDAVRNFNGTAWSQPTITATGLNPNNFVDVTAYANRLWFVERGTLNAWYLGTSAMSGPASLLPLGSLATEGGELIAVATWSSDGGKGGASDYLVFITSKGEVLAYTGTDPSSASTFALQGIYRVPEPIGRRCNYKIGAELIIVTSQGPVPLSQVAGLSVASATNKAITDKIAGAFRDAYASSGTNFGWCVVEWPKANLLFVNVPILERAKQEQFVFGTTMGGWSRFLGFEAGCWSLLGDDIFYGGNDGVVRKLGITSDEGAPIVATYRHAFTSAGSPDTKVFKTARPRVIGPPGYQPTVQISTDYDTSPITAETVIAMAQGVNWDESFWDTADWASEASASQAWQSVDGIGSSVSIGFSLSSTFQVILNGVDLAYDTGGLL